jgi:hypothetical protein
MLQALQDQTQTLFRTLSAVSSVASSGSTSKNAVRGPSIDALLLRLDFNKWISLREE